MDYSAKLDALQQTAAKARADARAAATETREKLKARIDQAESDVNHGVTVAKQRVGESTERAQSKWAQMKADASAKRAETKAKMDKRSDKLDAKVAATDADWAETEALDAIDFATWTTENARLAVLDAIYARAYADERAKIATP
jgi:hypothetical protein